MDTNQPTKKPTIIDVVHACQDVLGPKALRAIEESSDFDQAVDRAYNSLIRQRIGDPEGFLIKKGILQRKS